MCRIEQNVKIKRVDAASIAVACRMIVTIRRRDGTKSNNRRRGGGLSSIEAFRTASSFFAVHHRASVAFLG